MLKQDIPFVVGGRPGYLHVYEPQYPPVCFQVMVWDRRPAGEGWYYHGYLMFHKGYFYLEKMELQEHLEQLSDLVMVWWG